MVWCGVAWRRVVEAVAVAVAPSQVVVVVSIFNCQRWLLAAALHNQILVRIDVFYRGSGPENDIFSSSPKIIFESSNLLF